MFGPEMGIQLGTNMTPEECLEQSGRLSKIRQEIGRRANDKGEQWQNAIATGNNDVKRVLWDDYSALWTDYRIVSAWSELFYAIHVFMTDGTESEFMQIDYVVIENKSL